MFLPGTRLTGGWGGEAAVTSLKSRQREEQQVLHCLFFPSLRIEEEELDKYSIPAKTESDKYKVIRTFSFLKSRMSSTRNKTKVEGKKKNEKQKDLAERLRRFAVAGAGVRPLQARADGRSRD